MKDLNIYMSGLVADMAHFKGYDFANGGFGALAKNWPWLWALAIGKIGNWQKIPYTLW